MNYRPLDIVRGLKMRGFRIKHDLRLSYVRGFEEAFQDFKTYGADQEIGNHCSFHCNGQDGMTMAIQQIRDGVFSSMYAVRYAFLDSDGKVLPDPECIGEIHGTEKTLYDCYDMLIDRFSSD